jgi:AraC-like DNA-binding protein
MWTDAPAPTLERPTQSAGAGVQSLAVSGAMNARGRPVRRPPPMADRRCGWNDAAAAATSMAPAVDIFPPDIATRNALSSGGMTAEVVQMTRRARVDVRFHAPVHLLVVVEQGVRAEGETSVEGLPRSSLRDLGRKLTFVPAGHAYHEWYEPSLLPRITYFYLDPAKLPAAREPGVEKALRTPRLFFDDPALWATAVKLRRLMQGDGTDSRLLFEALGVILAHELARPEPARCDVAPRARGGLAAWQQRTVKEYIAANLAEPISLATLANLVRLSTYHFCRAFKQSFGVPPHRYHTGLRMELAKALLAKPVQSVTDIGMTVGFSETSSFTAAFRKATGQTPTAYRRGVA